MIIEVNNENEMITAGKHIGALLLGGEIIELIGDVGSGKTTLTKGIAIGLGVNDNVQSPSYTISRVYNGRDNLRLAHYDFYRLNDAGIMSEEINETINDSKTITIIEWGNIIERILPTDKLSIQIKVISELIRQLELNCTGIISEKLIKDLKI